MCLSTADVFFISIHTSTPSFFHRALPLFDCPEVCEKCNSRPVVAKQVSPARVFLRSFPNSPLFFIRARVHGAAAHCDSRHDPRERANNEIYRTL